MATQARQATFEQLEKLFEIHTKALDELLKVCKETRDASVVHAEKASHVEWRGCFKTHELPAVTRFLQQFCEGEEVTLSGTHLELLKDELLRTQKVSSLTMGYQHYQKDERRAHFMVLTLHKLMVEKNKSHEVSPALQQNGVLAHELPWFREHMKYKFPEEYKQMPFKELAPTLQAMYDLVQPVDRSLTPRLREENQRTFMIQQDIEALPAQDDKLIYSRLAPEIKQAYEKIHGTEIDKMKFTNLVVELFSWFKAAQAAKELNEARDYADKKKQQQDTGKRSWHEEVSEHVQVFEQLHPSEFEELKRARLASPQDFKHAMQEYGIHKEIYEPYGAPSASKD